MKTKVKAALMKKMLLSKKEKNPFDERLAELYQLPQDAPVTFNNSYYFSGHSISGESIFLRLGLRGDGSCEVWFVYRNGALFYRNPVTEYVFAEESPLKVSCIESSKTWRITYEGLLQDGNQENAQPIMAKFSGIFTATDPIYDFFYHASVVPLARAMAQEKWSKSFFAEVQENNQTHYEQNGQMSGTLLLGEQEIAIDIHTVRDHSFGKRDWNYMNKHMWLAALLENGDMVNISMVSYPAIKQLNTGNVILNGHTASIVETIAYEDMINDGKGPEEFHLACVLENGKKITVYGKKETEVVYSLGEGGYILREGLGTFTVDGKRARGIIEFGFNADSSRW